MPSRFVSLTVTPGVDCKVILPPCSALTLSNAALAAQPKSAAFGRCVLECDLATHSFVVCSLLTTGVRQAAPEITITNDPDEPAWFFLKVRAPLCSKLLRTCSAAHPPARSGLAGERPALLPRARPAHRGQGDTPVVGRCGAEAGAAAGRAGACPHRSSPGGACFRAAESPRWCLRHDRGAAPERRRGARLRSAVRRRLGGVHRVHAGAPGAQASEPSRAHQSSSEALEQRARRGWPPEVTARA